MFYPTEKRGSLTLSLGHEKAVALLDRKSVPKTTTAY